MKRLLAAALTAGALALPAWAADAPKADLFGGYSYLKADETTRHGWEAALGWNVRGKLGVIADLSRQRRNDDGVTADTFSYMGGLRFALHGNAVTPFVQALAGRVHSEQGIQVLGFSGGETHKSLGWAVGGGLELKVRERWAVRIQGDYFRFEATKDAQGKGNPRAALGVAYRFGVK